MRKEKGESPFSLGACMTINFKALHRGSCQEPATVTGEISIQNSCGCDQVIKKKISQRISNRMALHLLSFVPLSSTERN